MVNIVSFFGKIPFQVRRLMLSLLVGILLTLIGGWFSYMAFSGNAQVASYVWLLGAVFVIAFGYYWFPLVLEEEPDRDRLRIFMGGALILAGMVVCYLWYIVPAGAMALGLSTLIGLYYRSYRIIGAEV